MPYHRRRTPMPRSRWPGASSFPGGTMYEARVKVWHWLYCRWYDLRESHPRTAEVFGHLADAVCP